MLERLPEILIVVAGFGLLIVVHELGHFLVAKKVGIRCPQFAVGFGRALCSYRKGVGLRVGSTEGVYRQRVSKWLTEHNKAAPSIEPPAKEPNNSDGSDAASDSTTDSATDSATQAKADAKTEAKSKPKTKIDPDAPLALRSADLVEAETALGLGQTEYRLNWMPLGGYVKMLGQEDLDPSARSDDPQAFNSKSVGARSLVISAGVVVNLIVGILLFVVAFAIGVPFPSPSVGGVASGSAAATTFAQGHEGDLDRLGLQTGDKVLSVDGQPATDWTQVRLATALARAGDQITLEIDRAGEPAPLTYLLTPKPEGADELLSAGIEPPRSLIVAGVSPETGLGKAHGLAVDMVLTQVGDAEVASWSEVQQALNTSGGQPVELVFTGSEGQPPAVFAVQPRPGMIPAVEGPNNLLGLTTPLRVAGVFDGPAQSAGMQEGDLIARVDDIDWPTNLTELAGALSRAGDNPVTLEVWRNGQRVALTPVQTDDGKVGIAIEPALDAPRIARVLDDSIVARAAEGPAPPGGSKLVAVDGKPVANWSDIQARIMDAGARGEQTLELTFEVNRAGQPTESVFVSLADQAVRNQIAAARWAWPGDAVGAGFKPDTTIIRAQNPLGAMAIGLTKTKESIQQVYLMIARLWQGTVKVQHLRGPVGIVNEGVKVTQRGLPWTLFFFGLISVNLAVINFLPIPVVDGGHMIFLAIEKVRGAPAPAALQTAALVVGLALIGFVFLATTFYDVPRLWNDIRDMFG
ncbi:MAG: site-2 protease family protein [Planctomycetota bacterium]